VNSHHVSRNDWLVGGTGLLLAIDLLFFPWLTASVGFAGLSLSVSSSATGGHYGFLGVLAVIAALAVLVDLVLERRFRRLVLPVVGGANATTRFALAVVAATSLGLRFALQIHFTGILRFDWGFYLGVALAAVLVYLTEHEHNLERLASSRPRGGSRGAGGRDTGHPTGPAGPRAV
jgi:hypothetical protein